jgi:glycogen operon protein
MLLGGDEFGRTQQGNNNAYCQDSELSWYDWEHQDRELLEWTRALITLRRDHPVFRRRRFFQGRPLRQGPAADRLPDIAWFRPDGQEMTDADWNVGYAKTLGVFLNGLAIPDPDEHGRPIVDDSFFLILNAWDQDLEFVLPAAPWSPSWEVVLDTGFEAPPAQGRMGLRPAGPVLGVGGRSVLVLQAAPAADTASAAVKPFFGRQSPAGKGR